MAPMNITVSAVLLQEGNSWVAQALEFDITAQGKTLKAASEALERTLVGQLAVDVAHGLSPFDGIEQAPQRYWDHFYEAQRLGDRKPLRVPIPSRARVTLDDTRVFA